MKAGICWICEHSYLLLGVLAISCIQAATLAYGDLGNQVIANDYEQLPGAEVTHLLIFNHLKT